MTQLLAKEINFNRKKLIRVKDFFIIKGNIWKTYHLYSVLVGKHRFTLYPDQFVKWMSFWELENGKGVKKK